MNKILNWMYMKLRADNDILLLTHSFGYVLHMKALNYNWGLYIYMKKLMYVMFSLMMFLMFYKYDIQLISENYMVYMKMYLNICFMLYMGVVMYKIIMGFYESMMLKQYTDYMGESVLLMMKLMTFLVNMGMFYSVLNLNMELFLQYNMLLMLDLVMMAMFWYYSNMLDYEMKGDKFNTFLNYPWMMLMIMMMCMKLKVSSLKYFNFFMYGNASVYHDAILEENKE